MSTRKDADWLDNLMKWGVDVIHRKIYFGKPTDKEPDDEEVSYNAFDQDSVKVAIMGIHLMEEMSSKPITIYMNSYGGCAESMMALHDTIQETRCKFVFYGKGHVGSSATWIMCCCDERYLSKLTRVLLHEGANDPGCRTLADQKIYQEEEQRIQSKLNQVYADNSYPDKKFYDRLTSTGKDIFISAEEALELGLIDEIVEYRKRGNYRKGPRKRTFDNLPKPSELKKLYKALCDRISIPAGGEITVEIKKEEYEPLQKEFDNTEEVLSQIAGEESNEKKENQEGDTNVE